MQYNYNFSEIIKFRDQIDFETSNFPDFMDRYYLLQDIVKQKKLSHRVLGIGGILPLKRPQKIRTMSFVSISTNKTYFAALKEVQALFGEFYLESGIFPKISVIPKEFLIHPKDVAPSVYRRLKERGALIYGTER